MSKMIKSCANCAYNAGTDVKSGYCNRYGGNCSISLWVYCDLDDWQSRHPQPLTLYQRIIRKLCPCNFTIDDVRERFPELFL